MGRLCDGFRGTKWHLCLMKKSGKLLALDVGLKRTGVAETDALQMIASPKTTVPTTEILFFIQKALQEGPVAGIVVGDPKDLSGGPSDASPVVAQVVAALQKHFPEVPVVMVDERFTSKMASQAMVQGGMAKKKRQEKGMVDQVSAAIILQSFLNQHH